MSKPLVSVIVPNYNHARFLPKRLESILTQTFKNYELIVLDDASPDNSRAVIESYAARAPMRVTFNEQNTGSPFKQWARGAELANGEYIWLAESDDFADPRLLETLVGRLKQHPQCGLAYSQSYAVDEHDTVQRDLTWSTQDLADNRWSRDFVNDGRDEVARFLIRRCTIPNASAVLVRADLLRDALLDQSHMRLAGDWRVWARVLLKTDVVFVAEPLNYFRCHGASVRDTTKAAAVCEECFSVMADICSQVAVTSESRRKALLENLYLWKRCYEVETPMPARQWLGRVHGYARRIHSSATSRMAWFLMKHLLKRAGFGPSKPQVEPRAGTQSSLC